MVLHYLTYPELTQHVLLRLPTRDAVHFLRQATTLAPYFKQWLVKARPWHFLFDAVAPSWLPPPPSIDDTHIKFAEACQHVFGQASPERFYDAKILKKEGDTLFAGPYTVPALGTHCLLFVCHCVLKDTLKVNQTRVVTRFVLLHTLSFNLELLLPPSPYRGAARFTQSPQSPQDALAIQRHIQQWPNHQECIAWVKRTCFHTWRVKRYTNPRKLLQVILQGIHTFKDDWCYTLQPPHIKQHAAIKTRSTRAALRHCPY